LLALLLVAVVATGVFASWTLYRSAEDHYVGVALPLRGATRDVLYQMQREESSVRGYVITGNRSSLDAYFEGRRGVRRDLGRLEALAQPRPRLRADVVAVRRRVVALHGFYDRLIVFVADGDIGTARAHREVPPPGWWAPPRATSHPPVRTGRSGGGRTAPPGPATPRSPCGATGGRSAARR